MRSHHLHLQSVTASCSTAATPLLRQLPQGGQLIATSVASPVHHTVQVLGLRCRWRPLCALSGLGHSSLRASIATKKRFAVPLLLTSILLFYLGVGFAYAFVFPVMFEFFVGTTPQGVQMMTGISSYLGFVLVLLFAFGVAFEVPVAVVLLVVTGIIGLERLRRARAFVLIGIFVLAAFLTPPDIVSQTLMAVPMYLLFESGILMARILMGRQAGESGV